MKQLFYITLLLISVPLFAQRSIVSAGGNATGSSGSASFSVGIVSYKDLEDNLQDGGIQTPIEVVTLENDAFNNDQINIVSYPNPVNNLLKIKVDDSLLGHLSYSLYDNNGKIIFSEKAIKNVESEIDVQILTTGMYFIAIKKENQTIKKFKIIKK
jgi:hypothetical protein